MAEERGLVAYKSRDGQEIKLSFDTVRKFLVSGKPEFVTDQEIVLYMGTCKARGLNPFKKDCYLVKYTANDAAATIVSIDYFRSRAKAQPDCVGWQSGVIAMDKNDQLQYRKGAFMLEGDTLLGGWFKAKPKGWTDEYEWSVNLKPYVKRTSQGQVTQFWQDDKQPLMIAKVAESQGLRKIWPDEFQGLFIEGEIVEHDITLQTNLEAAKELSVIAHRIKESQRKRFYMACSAKGLSDEDVGRILALYGYTSNHEIMTDKFDEIMGLVESKGIKPKAEPAPSDNPQDISNAPTFTITTEEMQK